MYSMQKGLQLCSNPATNPAVQQQMDPRCSGLTTQQVSRKPPTGRPGRFDPRPGTRSPGRALRRPRWLALVVAGAGAGGGGGEGVNVERTRRCVEYDTQPAPPPSRPASVNGPVSRWVHEWRRDLLFRLLPLTLSHMLLSAMQRPSHHALLCPATAPGTLHQGPAAVHHVHVYPRMDLYIYIYIYTSICIRLYYTRFRCTLQASPAPYDTHYYTILHTYTGHYTGA